MSLIEASEGFSKRSCGCAYFPFLRWTPLFIYTRAPYLPYRFLHRVNAKKFHGKEQILHGGFDGFSSSEFTGSFTDVISLFSR